MGGGERFPLLKPEAVTPLNHRRIVYRNFRQAVLRTLARLEEAWASTHAARERAVKDQLAHLRVEVQNFRSAAFDIRDGRRSLAAQRPYMRSAMRKINAMTGCIPDDSESAHAIIDTWEEVSAIDLFTESADGGGVPLQQQAADITHLVTLLDRMLWEIGSVTLPAKIRTDLDRLNPGQYLPFDAVLERELPNEEHRDRFLKLLALNPSYLPNGIVEAPRGRIYRHSGDPKRSAASVFVTIAVFGAVLAGAVYLLSAHMVPGVDPLDVLLLWGTVSLGFLLHGMVEAGADRHGGGGDQGVHSLQDVVFKLEAHQMEAVGKGAATIIAVFVVLLSLQTPQGGGTGGPVGGAATYVTAFLAGYSLDSLINRVGGVLRHELRPEKPDLPGTA